MVESPVSERTSGVNTDPTIGKDVKYLYRYRSLADPRSSNYVEQILLRNELYFSPPREFNDPFDCSPVPSLKSSGKEFHTFLGELTKRRRPDLSRSARRAQVSTIARDLARNQRSKEAQEALRADMNKIVNETGILCLSAGCDHPLMWSHYADSHRGICLRFQASSTTPFFGRAQRVSYQSERPTLNLVRDTIDEKVQKALLTKADYWSYEAEWRIIDHDAGPGVRQFPPELLDGVILGARISDTDKQKVLGWLEERQHRISVLYARTQATGFGVAISGS